MTKHEPYKIKSIRNIQHLSFAEREKYLRDVNFNVGLLSANHVAFDMVTQGSSAMSQEQISSLFIGDEAYAGSRNFYKLNEAVRNVFGMEFVCPTHNFLGGIKLLCSAFIGEGGMVAANTDGPQEMIEYFGGKFHSLPSEENCVDSGNISLSKLTEFLQQNKGKLSFIYIDLQGEGYQTISLENLNAIKNIADSFNTKLVLNVSCISELAYYFIKHKKSIKYNTTKALIKELATCCHTLVFDAGQDAMSNVGGFLATNIAGDYEKYQNHVVIFEGLHTYGGMAGRTMEVVADGLSEMADDLNAEWIDYQVSELAKILDRGHVPFTRGLNGIYLHSDQFIENSGCNSAHTLACALYLTSGIRAHLQGKYQKEALLPVLIPRRALMNSQLEQIADVIVKLYEQRKNIPLLVSMNEPNFHYEACFKWSVPNLEEYTFSCEPYVIHAVEHIGMRNYKERYNAIKEAGYNTFLLKSDDVSIDLLTDSGTSAMSVDQWSAYLNAKETPATPDSYHEIVKTSQEIYGHKYIALTHQGRAAEHIMSQMFVKPGDYVPGNMYFTTTKLHQEFAGGTFVDVIVDEAHKTVSEFPWKGNIDLHKLEDLYEKATDEGKNISYVSFEFNVNMAGGQPVSMQNIKEVYRFCKPRSIPVFFDATRCAENACFIQRNDAAYRNASIADIILEMFSYGDGATISSKKDMLTNLSGSLLFKENEEWYAKALQMIRLFEGTYCSGGTSSGDMAAHAQGLREMINDTYINSRIDQTKYLGTLLHQAGVPIVLPIGGHAVFIDARRFLPHIDQEHFPAQMLAAQIFIETGVRAMERGNVSKGRNPETNENYCPELELVRLTIPRRVYTRDHIRAVADGIIKLYEKRHSVRGLRFTYEPEKLRFFQGRFEEIKIDHNGLYKVTRNSTENGVAKLTAELGIYAPQKGDKAFA